MFRSKSKSSFAALAVFGSLVLAGCGGSSGPTPAATGGGGGGGGTSQVGRLSVSYAGHPTPQIAQSANGITVFGLAGAVFTNLSFIPTHNLADTEIAYLRGAQIWMHSQGIDTQVTNLSGGAFSARAPSWSQDGRLAFCGLDNATSGFQIFTVNADGTGLRRLTTGGGVNPAWSPNNYKIAYEVTGKIYTINTDGSGSSLITTGTYPAWSPDGSKFAIVQNNGTKDQIYIVPSTGGTPHALTNLFQSYNCERPIWSPDGTKVYFIYTDGTNDWLVYADLNDTGIWILTNGNVIDDRPNLSPDGETVLWDRGGSGSNVIYSSTATGENAQPFIAASDSVYAASWSPFRTRRLFVGAGGAMFSTAAGFLLSQNGDSFASLLSFGARTPASATVTPESTLSYLIKADSLVALSYSNSYYSAPVSVIPAQNVAEPEALVSFSATTGQVTVVAPISPRSRKTSGSQMTYSGSIPAIYDGKGRNLAPHGASELTLDVNSGKLVHFR